MSRNERIRKRTLQHAHHLSIWTHGVSPYNKWHLLIKGTLQRCHCCFLTSLIFFIPFSLCTHHFPLFSPSLPFHFSPYSQLGSRYSVLENGSLFIDTALHGDSGCYTCSASNPAGTSSASVQLIVTHNGQPTAGSVAASLCVSDTNDSIDNSTSSSPACSLATGPITTTTPEGCRVLEDVSRDERNRASVETVVGGQGSDFYHQLNMQKYLYYFNG